MNVAKENLDESEITVLKDWLWAEYLLYDRFAENLTQNILKFGRKKMELKIAEYRILQKDVEKMCLLGKNNMAPFVFNFFLQRW